MQVRLSPAFPIIFVLVLIFLWDMVDNRSAAAISDDPELIWQSPPDFDIRASFSVRAPGGLPGAKQKQVIDRLRNFVGDDIRIVTDPLTGRPRHIFSYTQALTAPDSRQAQDIARDFINSVRDLYGLSAQEVANLSLEKEYETKHNRVQHVLFQQKYKDIEVFQATLQVNIDGLGQVINLAGDVFPGINISTSPGLSAGDALRLVVSSIDEELAGKFNPVLKRPAEGPQLKTEFERGPLAEDIEARLTIFPLPNGARLGWLFYLYDRYGINLYEVIIDAIDGELLYRRNLTSFNARGTVFSRSSPQPSATLGLLPPNPNPPLLIDRAVVPFIGDAKASPEGWLGMSIETIGNNVIAREDKAGDNEATLGATASAPDQDFTFPLQLGEGAPSPINFTDAAVTSLFYWCNIAHDYFYNLGFDEAAGNFQLNNFSKGGVEGDPVRADAQDGATHPAFPNQFRNNANFSTPPDGRNPRMQMFLFSRQPQGPYIDSAFDPEVILHEYAHGVSSRLVRGLAGFQGGAMGEGWSDFFALNFLVPSDAPIDGAYVVGSYVIQDFSRGIRTRPYSTDMAINPLTYADFGKVINRPEVHADGEIWVEALWDLRANLIKEYGFDEGKRRMELLVIDAMKLSAQSPTMVDMRDAILLADRVDFNSADESLIWQAFSKRGLGSLAFAVNAGSVRVVASNDSPGPAGKVRLYEGIYYPGEDVRILVADTNIPLFGSARVVLSSSSGDSETFDLLRNRTSSVFFTSLRTSSGQVSRGDSILQVKPGDEITAVYNDANDGSSRSGSSTFTARVASPYTISLTASQIKPPADERALNVQANDAVAQLSLPFEFPFFDQKYPRVFISTNGLISFNVAEASPINSRTALLSRAAIAPLWFDLRTNGSVQTGEDIYTSRPTPDSIMFRWVAESVEVNQQGGLLPGKPVNFAVTLFRDGTIRIDYGSGNSGFAPRSGIRTPTVGISRGTETFSQIATAHDDNANLDQAQAIIFRMDAAAPSVSIASPGAGQSVKGTITIRADATDDVEVAGVQFLIDGKAVGEEDRSAPYELTLDTTTLTNGPHIVAAEARDTSGNKTRSAPIEFIVANNRAPILARFGDLSVREGETLSFTLKATDPDGDALTFSAEGMPSRASLDPKTGLFTFSPQLGRAGRVFTITFTVSDGQGGSDSITVNLTVTRLRSGDLNDDNTIDVKDLTLLIQILLGIEPRRAAADVNRDGVVDVQDLIRLIQALVGTGPGL